ncbi:MAG: diaminopimelate epimerase [Candidatus Omnitrophica bacterium]|nr:diaminopimelate epimerase [Candidatus Omnitrophota bacterium]
MKKIDFYKLQASGNDFVLIDARKKGMKLSGPGYKKFAQESCSRKYGIGADGLLVIEESKKYDFTMRIFNVDGSEAEMCGNGARCVGLWAALAGSAKKKKAGTLTVEWNSFETVAGPIQVQVSQKKKNTARVRVQLSDVVGVKLDMPLDVAGRKIHVNYINTGVPHTVVFVDGIDDVAVEKIGREIRFHKEFSPYGTNVDFVEEESSTRIKIRTYERGVESETEACGTGVVAGAIVFNRKQKGGDNDRIQQVEVSVKNGEKLRVFFRKKKQIIYDVWFEGNAYLVYQGEYPLHR